MCGGRLCRVEGYAYMLRAEEDVEKVVHGYLFSCVSEEDLKAKLHSANEIEDYNPIEAEGFYKRFVEDATREADGLVVKAYVYHRDPYSVSVEEEIVSGDWVLHHTNG